MKFKELKTCFEALDCISTEFMKNIDEYMAEGGPYDVDKYLKESLVPLKAKDSDGKEKPFRSLFMDPQRRVVLSFEEFPISSSTEIIAHSKTNITSGMVKAFMSKIKDQLPQELVFMNSDGEKKKFS